MKSQSKTLKSYTISWTISGKSDQYSPDKNISLDEMITDLNSGDWAIRHKDFKGWNFTVFTAAEIEYLKSKDVFKHTYGYGIVESPLELGNCLQDTETGAIYVAYRWNISDIDNHNSTFVAVRKYEADAGVPLYKGFSSEIYLVPSDRVIFVSDRDLKNLGYDFPTNLQDSYMTY